MKVCPSCHRTFPDAKKYCNYCGEALASAEGMAEGLPAETASRCPSCGNAISTLEAQFCRFCGAPLKEEAAPVTPPPEEAPALPLAGGQFKTLAPSSRQGVWIAGIAALALLLAAGLIFVLRDSGLKSETAVHLAEAVSSVTPAETADSELRSEETERGMAAEPEKPDLPVKPSGAPPRAAGERVDKQKAKETVPASEVPEQVEEKTQEPEEQELAPVEKTQGLVPVREGQGLVPVLPPSPPPSTYAGRPGGSDLRRTSWEIKSEIFEVTPITALSASGNKKGDQFLVKVVTPERFKDAIIGGKVTKAKASGKVKGKSELLFAFENQLTLTDGTIIPIDTALVGIKNSQGVADVDEEGHMIGRSSKRQDLVRTGILSGIGAVVGGLTGGKEGAVKGAAIGAAVGLAVTFTTRGEDIRLAPGSIFELSVTSLDEPQQ